jgi:hypothetical protein
MILTFRSHQVTKPSVCFLLSSVEVSGPRSSGAEVRPSAGSACPSRPDSISSNSLCSFVPEGTSAVVHTYSLQRSPTNFSPMPDTFLPERWLDSDEQRALESKIFCENVVIHNTAAFIPFSVGPSNCVGRNLAYQVFNHWSTCRVQAI